MRLFYYCFAGVNYFRWEILSLVGIKRIAEKDTTIPVADLKKQFVASNHADFLPKENADEAIAIFQPFWDEANAYLSEMNPEAPKEEILFCCYNESRKISRLTFSGHKLKLGTAISGLIAQSILSDLQRRAVAFFYLIAKPTLCHGH